MAITGTGACFSVGPVNGATTTSGTHSGCELTLQANTLAGMCTTMVLHNTGSYAMSGWSVDFTLPDSGHLSNAWDANFIGDTGQVEILPTASDAVLQAGQSISVGFCSTVQAVNVNLTAGLCSTGDSSNPNIAGSAISNMTAAAPSNSFSSDFESLQGWNVAQSTQTGLPCAFAPSQVSTTSSGLQIATSAALCGAVSSEQSLTYGSASAGIKAAGGAGVLTAISAAAGSNEQINLQIDGSSPKTVLVSVTHDGVTSKQAVSVDFDTTAGFHTYGFSWAEGSVGFVVDGNSVASFKQNVPTGALHLVLSASTSSAGGQANSALFDSATYAP